MNSIPQNIKNEAENILKNVTKNVFNENLGFLCDLIFGNLSSIFLLSRLKLIILQIYQKAIQLIDKMFLDSDYRKKYYYKSSTQERCIISIYGELHFQRNYYVDKDKKNGFYLIDKLFGFEEYSTYDPNC